MKHAVLASLLAAGMAVGSTQTTNSLEIVMGGGYAMVVTGRQTLDVSPLEKPNIFALDYMHHPMKLVVEIGLLDPRKTTLPTTSVGGGRTGWDLSGRPVDVLDGDTPFPMENIELPTYTAVTGCGDVPASEVNNRYFLPDLPKMANQTALDRNWKDRLEGALTVHGGRLAVTHLTPGCFEFRADGRPVQTRRLASGVDGVTYSHAFASSITLRVYPDAKKQTTLGDIVLIPEGNRIRLALNTRDSSPSMKDHPIKHFKYFYDLLSQSVDHRQIPTWLGADSAHVTPGEACPPGFFEGQ